MHLRTIFDRLLCSRISNSFASTDEVRKDLDCLVRYSSSSVDNVQRSLTTSREFIFVREVVEYTLEVIELWISFDDQFLKFVALLACSPLDVVVAWADVEVFPLLSLFRVNYRFEVRYLSRPEYSLYWNRFVNRGTCVMWKYS